MLVVRAAPFGHIEQDAVSVDVVKVVPAIRATSIVLFRHHCRLERVKLDVRADAARAAIGAVHGIPSVRNEQGDRSVVRTL